MSDRLVNGSRGKKSFSWRFFRARAPGRHKRDARGNAPCSRPKVTRLRPSHARQRHAQERASVEWRAAFLREQERSRERSALYPGTSAGPCGGTNHHDGHDVARQGTRGRASRMRGSGFSRDARLERTRDARLFAHRTVSARRGDCSLVRAPTTSRGATRDETRRETRGRVARSESPERGRARVDVVPGAVRGLRPRR